MYQKNTSLNHSRQSLQSQVPRAALLNRLNNRDDFSKNKFSTNIRNTRNNLIGDENNLNSNSKISAHKPQFLEFPIYKEKEQPLIIKQQH